MGNESQRSRLQPLLRIHLPAWVFDQMYQMRETGDCIDSYILDHDLKHVLQEVAEKEDVPLAELLRVKMRLHPDEELELGDIGWEWDIIFEKE